METNVRTPVQIFGLPQRLVVPLFQRPYVWSEVDQWQPFWQDLRRLADLKVKDPYSNATHFLGAVVVQAHEGQLGSMAVSNVIDGQQRLTTLQLLMDATAAVLEELGLDQISGQLEALTHNQANFIGAGESDLKIRHSNRDGAAFDEVMQAAPPIDYAGLVHADALIVQAHSYFNDVVRSWIADDVPGHVERAQALVTVLTNGLQLVAINLTATENSQEIFETLNARGTPLTSADLIKNFVFQRLAAERADTHGAYATLWPFDSKFWEKPVSVGRYTLSRSSLFFNQWLISRTGQEVGTPQTFTRFKHYVEHESGQKVSDLLEVIKKQADLYQQWTEASEQADRQLSRTEMAVYRMRANDIEVLKPLLIWLHSDERALPTAQIDAVIGLVESWVVRRFLLRLTGSDHGRIVAELIHAHATVDADDLVDLVSSFLARQNASSTYWPGDEEIRAALRVEPSYRRFKRGRLRMLLEAAEDAMRAGTNQPQIPRRGYPIEHVLPQRWETNWPVNGLESEIDRRAHVHRLGNLTLLTTSLNSKVSNSGWPTKRSALAKHDTLLLNSRLVTQAPDTWSEELIDHRTDELITRLLSVWPVPAGHLGRIADTATTQTWVEVSQLVAAGLLEPGTVLTSRPGAWGIREAVVLPDGRLSVGEAVFDSPSGAAKFVRGAISNGWYFWRLSDGRRLTDVRSEFLGIDASSTGFDWSLLHAILTQLPVGRWTSYAALAEAVGTAPQPLGNHITTCAQCVHAYRVLTTDGSVATGFAWTDPADQRRPRDVLEAEGVAFRDDRADAAAKLTVEDLRAIGARHDSS